MDQKTTRTISNKEASDKMISARTKLEKLEEDIATNLEAFKLVDVTLITKLKANLLTASYKLHETKK